MANLGKSTLALQSTEQSLYLLLTTLFEPIQLPDALAGRLDGNFENLMTALPDHATKSFNTLGTSIRVINSNAKARYINNNDSVFQTHN
jgi:hypothetical protein